MPVTELVGGTVGEVNVGLAASLGFLNPLGAQLDAFLAVNLGPLQADLAAQLDAALALTASITLEITDPLAAIRAALQAVLELQAALTAALALPPINVDIGADLSVAASLVAALEVKLGLLNVAIDAMLAIKIPALQLAGNLNAALSAGPIILAELNGQTLAEYCDDMAVNGLEYPDGSPLPPSDPLRIEPYQSCFGYLLITKDPAAFAALGLVLT